MDGHDKYRLYRRTPFYTREKVQLRGFETEVLEALDERHTLLDA